MNAKERKERVARLASAWFDGRATDESLAELNELLRGDPETCEHYLDLIEIHATLTHDHAGDVVGELFAGEPGPPGIAVRRPGMLTAAAVRWLALAATVVILAGMSGWIAHTLTRRGVTDAEPTTTGGVAVLSRLIDAAWKPGAAVHEEGDTLAAGTFELGAGLAQIEFFSGASVIVEGPAELEIIDAWLAECRVGRLRVSVPEPARGFTIGTAEYRAVDLGTEFALAVGADGRSEVHVIEGEVRIDHRGGSTPRTLTTGAGMRASGGGGYEPVTEGGHGFINRRELLTLARDDSRSRHAAWARSRAGLIDDPGLLAWFDFEGQEPWDRQLVNRSKTGADGAIIGGQWTEGRWPGKGALEFKRISDRVRVSVPGEFGALTLAASVRIEGLDRWLSSLLLTDGFDHGEAHWQISDQGELIVGVAGGRPHHNSTSPPVIAPDSLGRWLHLAVTMDRDAGVVRHYLDGELVSEHRDLELPPLRIGDAEIGNWQALTTSEKSHPIRSFNGRMDELMVFDRALDAGEIARLHSSHREQAR